LFSFFFLTKKKKGSFANDLNRLISPLLASKYLKILSQFKKWKPEKNVFVRRSLAAHLSVKKKKKEVIILPLNMTI
jgi:hypothetical protein